MKPIPQLLIDRLKEIFPDALPQDPIDINQLRFLQGQQSVIRKLEDLYLEILEEK